MSHFPKCAGGDVKRAQLLRVNGDLKVFQRTLFRLRANESLAFKAARTVTLRRAFDTCS